MHFLVYVVDITTINSAAHPTGQESLLTLQSIRQFFFISLLTIKRWDCADKLTNKVNYITVSFLLMIKNKKKRRRRVQEEEDQTGKQ